MTTILPLPSDGATFSWDGDGGASTVSVRWENEGWTANGTIERARAQFVLRLSATWRVQQFLLFRDMAEPDLWLGTDRFGKWGEVNGAVRADLAGCTDVLLAGTPFTAAATIRRLEHDADGTGRVRAAVVDPETLGVTAEELRFVRTSVRVWRYPGLMAGRDVDATVDDHGIVVDEPPMFFRTAAD